MDFVSFTESLNASEPPRGLRVQLLSLWYDGKDDWEKAHELINDLADSESAWVHAYLHRKEGDLGNAGYWYRRAGKEMPALSLRDEWRQIADTLIKK